MATEIPPLPEGFTLDQPGGIPPLPEGFTLDTQASPQEKPPVGDLSDAVREPLVSLATGAVATPLAGLAGLGTAGARALGLTEAEPADVVRGVQGALTYQPRTRAGQAATDLLSVPFEKLAQGADFLGQKTLDATGSPALATAVNTAVQSAPAVLGKAIPKRGNVRPNSVGRPVVAGEASQNSAVSASSKRSPGLERVPSAAPTIEELAEGARLAYKRASDAGIAIAPESFGGFSANLARKLESEGIDPTLHPSTTAALRRIAETDGPVSLDKLETLRRIANDARKSTAPADRRLASMIVDDIDDFVAKLDDADVTAGNPKQAAALKEARNLYSRRMKAEEINQLIERAKISAPNFSASGLENAIRTEFRALAKNDKKMRRFTPAERAAIVRVAKGGKVENALRLLGKFAPTGVVSTGLSGGVGFALAGPAGGVALPMLGLGSRAAATRMTLRNAQRAEELMRRGPANALVEEAPVRRNALMDF